MKTIRIEYDPDGWTVWCDHRYEDRLGADEALWIIARLLMGQENMLRTKEEHDAWQQQYGPKPVDEYETRVASLEREVMRLKRVLRNSINPDVQPEERNAP